MSQDVKLHIFQQIHTPSGNRLTGSYFCSVTGYDKQTSFTALMHSIISEVPSFYDIRMSTWFCINSHLMIITKVFKCNCNLLYVAKF